MKNSRAISRMRIELCLELFMITLFEDKAKYDAIMNALAGVIYREMRELVEK